MLEQLNHRLDLIREIAGKRNLVVVGTAKSGTTWVQRLLDSHPEIHCVGEGKFPILMSGLLDAVAKYNQWLNRANRIVYGGNAFYKPWDDDTTTAAFQFCMAMSVATSSHKDFSRVKYIGDKDTLYEQTIQMWSSQLLPDARFVHIIRDGRDCSISNMYHRKRSPEYGDTEALHPGTELFYSFVEKFAQGWAKSVRNYRSCFADQPGRYHEVRYEDLIADPDRALASMLQFLEVDDSSDLVATIVRDNAFDKLSGGRQAGEEDKGSFFRKGTAGDWKSHYDDRARELFLRHAGDLLRELRYELA